MACPIWRRLISSHCQTQCTTMHYNTTQPNTDQPHRLPFPNSAIKKNTSTPTLAPHLQDIVELAPSQEYIICRSACENAWWSLEPECLTHPMVDFSLCISTGVPGQPRKDRAEDEMLRFPFVLPSPDSESLVQSRSPNRNYPNHTCDTDGGMAQSSAPPTCWTHKLLLGGRSI
jgi:hypothetical protein